MHCISYVSLEPSSSAMRQPVLGEAEDNLVVDMIDNLRIIKEKVTCEWGVNQAQQLFHKSRSEE
ncbi:hypothetical protein GN244_ATG05971 [Phytophthora infestans]|uniref:Uncharacterized protein n=1 Tax=Phytophthora infestans TaxID=4787 RepID=A0A833TJ57_PHYIN|nr:hypothetical protein GN244_ATG05971 [Phytophthora infestans]